MSADGNQVGPATVQVSPARKPIRYVQSGGTVPSGVWNCVPFLDFSRRGERKTALSQVRVGRPIRKGPRPTKKQRTSQQGAKHVDDTHSCFPRRPKTVVKEAKCSILRCSGKPRKRGKMPESRETPKTKSAEKCRKCTLSHEISHHVVKARH